MRIKSVGDMVRELRRDRYAELCAVTDRMARVNQLGREAIAARAQNRLMDASRYHAASVLAWRAARAEQDDPEPQP